VAGPAEGSVEVSVEGPVGRSVVAGRPGRRSARPVTSPGPDSTGTPTPPDRDGEHPGRTAGRSEPHAARGSRLRRIGPDTRPLSVPAYRRLFLGQVATVIGAASTAVAVQQQIYDITGSSARVGSASIALTLVAAALGPSLWRYDSRRRTGGDDGSIRPVAGASTVDGATGSGPLPGSRPAEFGPVHIRPSRAPVAVCGRAESPGGRPSGQHGRGGRRRDDAGT
jgi:hypothetical protein